MNRTLPTAARSALPEALLALFALAALLALAPAPARAGHWLPFRIAVHDLYENETEWSEKASSVYGLRLGVFLSANRDVYGLSLTAFCDGGLDHICADDNFAGLKFGGFSTIASGNGAGLQLSCFYNGTSLEMRGLQISGFVNSAQFLRGVQIAAGHCEATTELHGLQVAAICECGTHEPGVSESGGLQLAAIRAACDGAFSGIQIAPCAEAYEMHGLQIGLLGTTAQTLSGVQIGAINHADEMHGLQIGLVNTAQTLSGVQIGAFNASGTEGAGNFRVLPGLNMGF